MSVNSNNTLDLILRLDQSSFFSSFKYGGCLGNGNRFPTREACESKCIVKHDIPVCNKPKAEGACNGNFIRWFYNKEVGDCEQFSFSGCMGNNNRFMSYQECSATCQHAAIRRNSDAVCSKFLDEGNCEHKRNNTFARWGFHPLHKR